MLDFSQPHFIASRLAKIFAPINFRLYHRIENSHESTKHLVLAVATTAVVSWSVVAVQIAPAKTASVTRNESAKSADNLFWQALHSGNYDSLPKVTRALTAAYLEHSNDSATAAHLCWSHIWGLAESSRLDDIPPMITDEAVLARRYFQEAVALHPRDARYLGFLGSTQLAEGMPDVRLDPDHWASIFLKVWRNWFEAKLS